MIQLDKLLDKVNTPLFMSTMFAGWQPGQNVPCPFAESRHAKGTDKNASMSVSADGKVFCHACGYKATTLLNLYNDMFGYEFREGCASFYAEFVGPVVPHDFIETSHKALLSNTFILTLLHAERGITQATVKAWKLGWSKGRLVIPILDEVGICVNARRYDLLKKGDPMFKVISYDKGFGKGRRLFPVSALLEKKVYVMEGEMDTLLARQYGLNAVTMTSGVMTEWTEDVAKQFLDKDVVFVPDIDKPGLEGMAKRARALGAYANSISTIMLPLPGTNGKKDFTDFVLHHSIAEFHALKAQAYAEKVAEHKVIKDKEICAKDILVFEPTQTEQVNLGRAEALFAYLKGKGAFFKNINGILFYARKGGDIFRVSAQDSQFLGFLSGLSPLLNTAVTSGKFIMQHVINCAQVLCTFSKSAFWSLLTSHDLFVHGTQGNILHFKDGKMHKIPNAINSYNVLLELPHHTLPLDPCPEKLGIGVQMFWDKVMSNMAVSDENRYLLMCWLMGVFFRVEVRNKPLLRLSASTAYGKSTASKLLSILLYGDEMLHHSASTIASIYSLAAEYPLLIFDNLETRNMVPALEDFLIVAATGGTKSKRVQDTTSAVAFERVDSLVLTNGIEPFSKHEILNRTIELPLNIDRYGKAHFHELKVIEDLKVHRNAIMYSLITLLSKRVVPRFMSNEVQRIARHFDAHSKERFNEYFGVMAVVLDAFWPYLPLKGYAMPHDLVNHWMTSQNVSSKVSDESTNDVLYFLDTFAKRRNNLMDAGVNVVCKDGKTMIRCHTRDLLSDFRLLAKHLGVKCPWQNERQLGTRLADASEILHKAGWERQQKILSGRRIYEFTKKG